MILGIHNEMEIMRTVMIIIKVSVTILFFDVTVSV